MRIPAFYAHVPGVGLTDYWHDNGECFIAKSIAPADRLPGHGPRTGCPYCAMLHTPVSMTRRKPPKRSEPGP